MGFHLWELDAKKRLVRLHYLIYEDWHGKVHYLTKNCSFSENLMAFFRLPYQKQKLSTYEVKQDSNLLSYIQRQLSSRNTSWLKRQEKAYLQGKNLLTLPLSAFFPQVRPQKLRLVFVKFHKTYQTFMRSSGVIIKIKVKKVFKNFTHQLIMVEWLIILRKGEHNVR